MQKIKVAHILDDATIGGVTRVIDFALKNPKLAKLSMHSRYLVKRGDISWKKYNEDIICVHIPISWKTLPKFIALRLRHLRSRILYFEHHYSKAYFENPVSQKIRFKFLYRISSYFFTEILAVSKAQYLWLETSKILNPNKLILFRPCIDLQPFFMIKKTNDPSSFLFLGRLEDQKGIDILLETFANTQMSEKKLHIFGTGSLTPLVRSYAEKYENIFFHGFLSEPQKAFDFGDNVIIPSKREPYGLVAIEAIAAGKTVFVSNIDGLVDHEEYGAIVVTKNTPKEWAITLSAEYTCQNSSAQKPIDSLIYEFEDNWLRQFLFISYK